MKKILISFVIIGFFFLGIMAGGPSRDTASNQLQKELDEFEEQITQPNNNYDPVRQEEINPNITNSIAKKGEKLIDKIFGFSLKIVENMVG